MRVLVAMSGGVDSSVTAALLQAEGHDVVGATMKLWGGASDSGCCSVSDVEDARRVAQQLGITHHVFNFGDDFMKRVVEPYVDAHAKGQTPNPCIECNRHVKFDRFIKRAMQLGFDAVATGHHAQVAQVGERFELRRGADDKKDQSYVLHMLGQNELSKLMLPVGHFTKDIVREMAVAQNLRTAMKPDSQDVCFITSTGGRSAFLGDRISLKPGRVVDTAGNEAGAVDAVELVTVGQRRGFGAGTHGEKRYAVDVDTASGVVTVGSEEDLLRTEVGVANMTFTGAPVIPGTSVMVQISAHGAPFAGTYKGEQVAFEAPQRRVAPGQSVVLYRDDVVLGGATAL